MFTGKWYKTWGQGVRNESSEGGYNREEEGMERQGEDDEIMMSHHGHECSATDHDISRYVTPAPDERGSNQGGWAHAHTRQVYKTLGINICMCIYIYINIQIYIYISIYMIGDFSPQVPCWSNFGTWASTSASFHEQLSSPVDWMGKWFSPVDSCFP